ncbi:unnamed protein product [Cyclocybe aegerita]|uniref:Uncharacterized protein n=1 Tax=Cyclocybe aegerita TaxID=1973307 RepID=A0A8S0WWI8_CYCAE|nr:unnamed protein product [Cyclocybe aegerita]
MNPNATPAPTPMRVPVPRPAPTPAIFPRSKLNELPELLQDWEGQVVQAIKQRQAKLLFKHLWSQIKLVYVMCNEHFKEEPVQRVFGHVPYFNAALGVYSDHSQHLDVEELMAAAIQDTAQSINQARQKRAELKKAQERSRAGLMPISPDSGVGPSGSGSQHRPSPPPPPKPRPQPSANAPSPVKGASPSKPWTTTQIPDPHPDAAPARPWAPAARHPAPAGLTHHRLPTTPYWPLPPPVADAFRSPTPTSRWAPPSVDLDYEDDEIEPEKGALEEEEEKKKRRGNRKGDLNGMMFVPGCGKCQARQGQICLVDVKGGNCVRCKNLKQKYRLDAGWKMAPAPAEAIAAARLEKQQSEKASADIIHDSDELANRVPVLPAPTPAPAGPPPPAARPRPKPRPKKKTRPAPDVRPPPLPATALAPAVAPPVPAPAPALAPLPALIAAAASRRMRQRREAPVTETIELLDSPAPAPRRHPPPPQAMREEHPDVPQAWQIVEEVEERVSKLLSNVEQRVERVLNTLNYFDCLQPSLEGNMLPSALGRLS